MLTTDKTIPGIIKYLSKWGKKSIQGPIIQEIYKNGWVGPKGNWEIDFFAIFLGIW